ncbi:hypothetical protein OROGR_018482 [Orobanche gracilis]
MSIMQNKNGSLGYAVKGNAVVVAVKACKEIPSAALKWALTNVVCPGDCVRFLVLIPNHSSNKVTVKMKKHTCAQSSYCSVIVVKHSEPKVLQLNLIEPRKVEEIKAPPCPKSSTKCHKDHSSDVPDIIKVPNVTPTTSPEKTSSTLSRLDMFTSATFMSDTNWEPKVMKKISRLPSQNLDFYHESDSDSESQILSSRSTSMCSQSSTDERPKLSKSKSGTCRFSEIYTNSPPLCSICHSQNTVIWRMRDDCWFTSTSVMVLWICIYMRNEKLLDWAVRQKIAVGAARGLRYLHEECRIGCIVHRDMRPNNILLTHDFEPLVGDFGLARMQVDGDSFEKTRIVGTFGYIAPEYAQTGQLCEKADVYSFGVVLIELSIKADPMASSTSPSGHVLLDANALYEHVDPCLMNCYSEKEVQTMLHCSSLCLQKHPQSRHRMFQGDILMI